MDGEVETLKKKRKTLCDSMNSLQQEAMKLYDKAEACSKMQFVVSANALRNGAAENEDELKTLDAAIQQKEVLLKSMLLLHI